mgnify:CR=1 FL=1
MSYSETVTLDPAASEFPKVMIYAKSQRKFAY